MSDSTPPPARYLPIAYRRCQSPSRKESRPKPQDTIMRSHFTSGQHTRNHVGLWDGNREPTKLRYECVGSTGPDCITAHPNEALGVWPRRAL